MFTLKREQAALLVMDVQERLFAKVEHPEEVFAGIEKIVRGCQIFSLPIVVAEQYPEGLGKTIEPLRRLLGETFVHFQKTAFSCLQETGLSEYILKLPVRQWILVGLEAHICIFQTARDLLNLKKEVVVVNEAISSRSIYDFSSAIAEMRDCGARISSVETVLFELLGNATDCAFKEISRLIQPVSCLRTCSKSF